MAETSKMLPLGTIAPDFQLLDTISQQQLTLTKLKSPIATVIMFICNHCPYVQHILPTLVATIKIYQAHHIAFIAISANDITNYPDDSPVNMQLLAKEYGFTFPYLYDESQQVAKAYHAACTPEFYVFDKDLKCVYRGRFDSATPKNNHPVTGSDLKHALDNLLNDMEVDQQQFPSIGCNIKWKCN